MCLRMIAMLVTSHILFLDLYLPINSRNDCFISVMSYGNVSIINSTLKCGHFFGNIFRYFHSFKRFLGDFYSR